MRLNYFFSLLFINLFFISTTASAQNFDETWKEFLENNKISNMSRLVRPNKQYEKEKYSQYLLMSTNNCFCQSKIEKAETLMEEINDLGLDSYESIEGYTLKKKDLEKRIEAYYGIEKIWQRFLKTRDVTVEELEDVYPPSTICEKKTLVKYSYMTAHYYLCEGDIEKSKNTFEKRTLKIAEKTTLRVKDVRGMAPEVKKMKTYFTNMPALDDAWDTYLETNASPGFERELPVFPCNPLPNLKAFVLIGAADPCGSGQAMLKKIDKLQSETGVLPSRDLREKIKELKVIVKESNSGLAELNKSWNSFIKTNEVKHTGYGYEYCGKEDLIRAYILDGFSYVCNMSEEMLDKIDSIQTSGKIKLQQVTMEKIYELEALKEEYESNGVDIDELWTKFVSQGDTLYRDYKSHAQYCDNIQHVKDWTMQGLGADCTKGHIYLEKIEKFNRSFDFEFYPELECRVQKLRIRVWD